MEWYRGTRDWIAGADEPPESKDAPKPSTAESKEFPRLETVPPRPQPPTVAERNQLAKSLAADRESARYSDEMIRRQTDSSGKMTETRPPVAEIPKASEPAPAPAPAPSTRADTPPPAARPVVPAVPAPPSGQPVTPAPFPPMPATPPAPAQMGAEVPPMPTPPPAAPAMPQTAMKAPPVPQPPPRAPATTPPPVSGENLTFGPPPADIALNSRRPVAPRGAGRQQFVPADPFSSRFPAGVGGVPESYATATGQKLGTVRFGVGSAKLSNSARAAIRRIAQTVKQSNARVRVVGHASSRTRNMDPLSHHMANFQISLDRANAVARELRRRGVAPAAITVEAVSDTDPVFLEVMPAGEAANRRVEILIEN